MMMITDCASLLLNVQYTALLQQSFGADEAIGTIINESKSDLWDMAENWANILSVLINDSIVAWRAWIIWKNKFSHYILLGLSIGNIVLNIGVSIAHSTPKGLESLGIWDWLSLSWSLGLNASVTGIIVIRAWKHHCTVKMLNLNGRSQRTMAERVFVVLIESSGIFCLFQFLNLVFNILEMQPGSLGSFIDIMYHITGQLLGYAPALHTICVFLLAHMLQIVTDMELSFHFSDFSQGAI
ncbi:hypothetical protein BT96DRAFT_922544 [Gymnopus androsaceus JB14]|uniref:Uncharacterized protein n=1 Tax=Gymnopus androsaceus JB14 TaxID=1447944 RepID=A0A6A4HC72_9AGAR|nr:hypothetical protein BT96DRAFT_922544 [Gymnopus androsaceus JB14]